jgi:hypothetical protein
MITADKIVANAITAKEIASQTITANQIASNTIEAGNLKAGTITAESGVIGSLDASKITTGTMSASYIQGGTLDIGGLDNGNGVVTVFDATGKEVSRMDNSGIAMKKGAITGSNMQIDVTNGKLIIGSNNVNDTVFKLKFDGTNLLFGDGAISWGNLDTDTQKNITPYTVSIVSQGGNVFRSNSTFSTILTAYIYQGETDVTDTIDYSRFRWTRTSDDVSGDSIWNNNHIGYKSITITQDDVRGNSIFNCEITD